MARREDLDRVRDHELKDFVAKVEKLQAEGLMPHQIATRLGLAKTTLNSRLRRYRELKKA